MDDATPGGTMDSIVYGRWTLMMSAIDDDIRAARPTMWSRPAFSAASGSDLVD